MIVQTTHKTIAAFCDELDAHGVIVNRSYQRSPGVWPRDAQSFLVETILLGFPIPKLALYQRTDVRSRRTITELVDGQQRATAIQAFYSNELRLSRKIEDLPDAAGCIYDELEEPLQSRFLTYSLGFDLLVDTTPAEIREIFRRINSYEFPLNPEEQRHARFQGAFKWTIYRIARDHGETLKHIGTFTEQNLVRMMDMKLLSEIAHALVNGISTTNKRSLDNLYSHFEGPHPDHDADFEFGDWLSEVITEAIELITSLDSLHGTKITKHFSVYSLVLAIIHASHDVVALRPIADGGMGTAGRLEIARSLGAIENYLESAEEENDADDEDDEDAEGEEERLGPLAALVRSPENLLPKRLHAAFQSRTNVKDQRETRFKFFLEAVRRR